jgi:GTP cyclohydrolase I
MGRDKAALVLEGRTLLERTVALLQEFTMRVSVSVRKDQQDDALRRGFHLLPDPTPELGPAAGLLAAHAADPRAAWLVVACDMPWLNRDTLARLVAGRDSRRGATAFRHPDGGVPEPLCAIYEPATLARLARDAVGPDRGRDPRRHPPPQLSPRALLTADTRWLESPGSLVLASVNTPPEWETVTAKPKKSAARSRSKSAARPSRRPTREEAEAAVRVLLGYIGENPDRPGLRKTPARFVGAYEDWFNGYRSDPREILGASFAHVDNFDRMVALTNIDFESHCEHHVAPVIGRVHLAYLPDHRLAGISKLVRVVECYTRRLIVQEKLTADLATCIQEVLEPRGVAVVVEARHHCLTTRGVHRDNVRMTTSEMLGVFRDDDRIRNEFLAMIGRAD